MSEDRTLDILKNAILLERRGYAFYSKVAAQAEDEAVKRFFNLMADEETLHIQILADQFKFYQEAKSFKAMDDETRNSKALADEATTSTCRAPIMAPGGKRYMPS